MARIEDCDWRGMAAWRLAGDELELVVTVIGGHLAAIRRPGSTLNPLWQPQWAPQDPATLDAAGIARLGGEPAAARLLASIVGHNLCIDRFGPPRPGEDRPYHGEAGCLPWRRAEAGATLCIRCELPQAGLRVERRFTLDGSSVEVETGVAHDGADARPIEWCEHVSLGDPFISGARIAAGVEAAWNMPGGAFEPGSRFAASGEAPLDPAAVLAMPSPQDAPCGDVASCALREGWFVVENHGFRLRYDWSAGDFPWLAVWTQHRSRTEAPWQGRERAKGLEFATKPFPEVEAPARAERFQGRPTTCLVPAGPGLRRRIRIAWQPQG